MYEEKRSFVEKKIYTADSHRNLCCANLWHFWCAFKLMRIDPGKIGQNDEFIFFAENESLYVGWSSPKIFWG